MTFEKILENMMARIPDSIDKREGSLIYNALAPAALEMALLYIELEVILNESFADTHSREYLIRRAMERGITPYEATSAEGIGEFSCDVPVGSRFILADEGFTVTERLSENTYKLVADKKGTGANKLTGELVPVEYIEGLESARLVEITTPGADEEETEAFRKRYLESLKNSAFGGNQAEYRQKVGELNGVGKVLVNPHYYGNGTVRLVISSDSGVPKDEFVQEIQNKVDPVSGEGLGIAPIGHRVTVEGVTGKPVDVVLSLSYQTGYTFDSVKDKIEKVIDDYFTELTSLWPDNSPIIVRVTGLERRLLDTEGILDVTYTSLNGSENNIELLQTEVPVRGEVSERE